MRCHGAQHGVRIPPPHPCGDAFGAPPGAAPFHRFLQARRLERDTIDTFELAPVRLPPETPGPPDVHPDQGPGLLPPLGEVRPVEPPARVARTIERVQRVHVPATGQLLDHFA